MLVSKDPAPNKYGFLTSSAGVAVLFGLVARRSNEGLLYAAQIFSGVWAFMTSASDIVITSVLCIVLNKELRGFNIRTDEIIWR